MADTEEKKVQEDEAEYESDSEAALLWAMRRKEASDEESEEEGKESRERFWRARIGGDDESDGLGGAMEYDDEESYIDELEVDDDLEEEMEEEVEREAQVSLGGGDEDRVSEVVLVKQESEEALRVPTAGKFYMHDDRFGAKRFGQRRGTPGRMGLWKPRDELPWKHDIWIPKGHHQGRIKDQSIGRGYIRANPSRPHDNFVNQDDSLRIVRGRGPVRYRPDLNSNDVRIVRERGPVGSIPFMKNSDVVPPKNYNRSEKFTRSTSYSNSARILSHASNIQSDSLASKNYISTSSLGSASPLYITVSSSRHEESMKQKTNAQRERTNRYHMPFVPLEDTKCSNTFQQGKTLADSVDLDKLSMDSSQPDTVSHLTNLPLQSPRLKSNPSSNQVNRVPLPAQPPVVQQRPTERTVQPPVQFYTPQLRPGNRSQQPYDSLPNSGETKVALVGKESGAVQSSSRSSFQYDGALADHNYAATSSLLPGPARTVGAAYHSPHVPLDDGYQAHCPGQSSPVGISRNIAGTNKHSDGKRHPDRSELSSDEHRQQHFKPRRQVNF
uniref:Btz domain-containing protein n=1 Tax=Fagus sylvatica TaxID=28930 RepID=A0A2N9H1T6_FAGSY